MPKVIAEWHDSDAPKMGLPWAGPRRDDYADPYDIVLHPATGNRILAKDYANLISPESWERAIIEVDYPQKPLIRWIRGERDVYGFCTETETIGEATHIDEDEMIAVVAWEGSTDPQCFTIPKQVEVVQEHSRRRDLWRHEL